MPIYMTAPHMPGGSTAPGYVDAFELQAINWGEDSTYTKIGGTLRFDKTHVGTVDIVKNVGVSTDKLISFCFSGGTIGEIVFSVTNFIGGVELIYEKYTLKNSVLLFYTVNGDAASGTPSENLSFSFSEMDYRRYKYKNDGTLDTPGGGTTTVHQPDP